MKAHLGLLLLFISQTGFCAAIYKWKDDGQQVHYSQDPPANRNAELVKSPIPSSTSTSKKSNISEQDKVKKLLADYQKEEDQKKLEAQKKEMELANEKAKAANCAEAKTHLQALIARPRSLISNPDGSSTYLAGPAREAEIERTKMAIEKNCEQSK